MPGSFPVTPPADRQEPNSVGDAGLTSNDPPYLAFAKARVHSCLPMSPEYHTATERPASLEEETRTTIEEARMVLPGIQALFGFQLIAVFNTRFRDFTTMEQVLHFLALLLIAVAIVLIMTPAAYHRIAERGVVSRRFIDLASRFLESAMVPLMLGISLDLFLLGRLILNNVLLSVGISVIVFLLFFSFWYVFPWTAGIVHARGKKERPGGEE